MARKKISEDNALGEIQAGVLKSITQNVDTLYRRHADSIEKVQNDSDEKKVTVNFAVQIDCSDSVPKIKTRIRYSETVTDEMIDSLEDPNQPTLFEPPEPKPRARRKASDDTTEGSED